MARPSGLGRGLSSLIPDAPGLSPVDGAQLLELPVTVIRPNTYQPRSEFDDVSLNELAESIRSLGVLQPLLVRPLGDGSYELIAGERRWRAAQRAGLSAVPAVVRSVEDVSALTQALVENLQRSDLSPLEEAAAFKQLIDDFQLTHDDVAERVGRSRASVTNCIRLLQLPPTIQRLLMQRLLSAGHARALLGTTDASFQDQLARRAVSEQLSVRAVEEAIRIRTEGASQAKSSRGTATPRAVKPAGLLELERVIADYLDTRVSIELGSGTTTMGRIQIDVADVEDLERVFRRMTGQPERPSERTLD